MQSNHASNTDEVFLKSNNCFASLSWLMLPNSYCFSFFIFMSVLCMSMHDLGNHSSMNAGKHLPCERIIQSFLYREQFLSNSCNCCLIMWRIHVGKCIQLDAAYWVWEFIHYNEEQSNLLSVSEMLLFYEYGSEVFSGKQCIALRSITRTTMRSCVPDHFQTERQKQTPDKRIVLIICPSAASVMASRITVIEIRPSWEKRKEGARREGEKERGKTGE